jgi:hypothetical protein
MLYDYDCDDDGGGGDNDDDNELYKGLSMVWC